MEPVLPPTIQILLDERLTETSSVGELRRKVKRGLLGDLKRQAVWSMEQFAYPDLVRSDDRVIPPSLTPSGAMNPFTWTSACVAHTCRVRSAKSFVQTLGVYGERIVLPDDFTASLSEPKPNSDAWMSSFLSDLAVLRELKPLVRKGVITFGSGSTAFCSDCREKAAEEAAVNLARRLRREFRFRFAGDKLRFGSESLFGRPLDTFRKLRAAEVELARELVQGGSRISEAAEHFALRVIADRLKRQMSEFLVDLATAQNLSSILVSGSRADVLCVRALEEGVGDLDSVHDWELARTIDLPWISKLTAEEVLILREEASTALPRFRELFLQAARVSDDSAASATSLVHDLRSQAAEVQAELDVVTSRGRRLSKTTLGLLAIGLTVYGTATGATSVTAGTLELLTMLGLIHEFQRHDSSEEKKLKSAPAYVLVKAKEIIDHRGHPGAG